MKINYLKINLLLCSILLANSGMVLIAQEDVVDKMMEMEKSLDSIFENKFQEAESNSQFLEGLKKIDSSKASKEKQCSDSCQGIFNIIQSNNLIINFNQNYFPDSNIDIQLLNQAILEVIQNVSSLNQNEINYNQSIEFENPILTNEWSNKTHDSIFLIVPYQVYRNNEYYLNSNSSIANETWQYTNCDCLLFKRNKMAFLYEDKKIKFHQKEKE